MSLLFDTPPMGGCQETNRFDAGLLISNLYVFSEVYR